MDYRSSELQESFQVLIDKHYEALMRYAWYLTDGEAVEDLVHDAFLAAFDRLAAGRGDSVEHWRPWLRGTLRHLVATHWRQKYKLPEVTTERLAELAAETDDNDDAHMRRLMLRSLKHCLQQLESPQKDMVRRHYRNRMPLARLAEIIGCAPGTLRVRLYRVRQWLKDCVERRLVELGEQ